MSESGRQPEYSQDDDWEDYCERLECYFAANDITNENKKVGSLITLVDAATYRLMKDLAVPKKPAQMTYKNLVAAVTKHKSPERNEMVERYNFHIALRNEGESVNKFLSRLKHLAEHCNFGDQLDTNLRDRFVTGIRDEHMLNKLLGEINLTLEKAVKVCIAMERASENTESLLANARVNRVEGRKKQTRGDSQKNNFQRNPHANEGKQGDEQPKGKLRCHRCGRNHDPRQCKWINEKCRFCSKKGHLESVCWRKHGRDKFYASDKTHQAFNDSDSTPESDSETESVWHVEEINRINDSVKVDVLLNGFSVKMEVDTGAARTIVGEKVWESINVKRKRELKPTSTKLKSFTGNTIPVIGEGKVRVSYGDKNYGVLSLIVVKGNLCTLLGRDWLNVVKLNWSEIFSISPSQSNSNPKASVRAEGRLRALLKNYQEIFKDELGTFNGGKASITMKPDAQPIFLRARNVPFSIFEDVEKELSKMIEQGILEPVRYSKHATPIVPVTHPNKTVRICGDYRATTNRITLPDPYPVPDIKQLLAKLGGGKWYCKIDLRKAFLQLELDEASQELCCLNTHKGLMKMKRLPFGCSQAPGIFQRTIEGLLGDIPRTVAFVDEILTTGDSEENCLKQLEAIFKRLLESGLRVNKEKCKFLVKELEYLGYRISDQGTHPLEKKVSAIRKAPDPENVNQLRAWLGLFNFYAKFLPNTATVLAPLYRLLEKKVQWNWGEREKRTFQKAKDLLTSERLLVHFDPTKPIVLSCDASPYGISCIMSHRFQDGTEKPIQCASRRLNNAEKNYSQTEREGLSVIYGVTKFHQWLWGRKFKIITDHQPLLRLFSETQETTKLAASRLVRWSILLSAYNYEIVYRPGANHQNADALSRLPVSKAPKESSGETDTVHLIRCLEEGSSLTFTKIEKASRRDPVIGTVLVKLRTGWNDRPQTIEEGTYYSRRRELGTQGDCLMWGSRIVIPKSLRSEALENLHLVHQGMSRTKQLARSYLWWPGIDKDIENLINACSACQLQSKMPPAAPVHPWCPTQKPWSRIHIDHAGPFLGKLFLVIVDSYSKWVDIAIVPSTSAKHNIKVLASCFANFGLPDMIVSDNGTGFTSHEFQHFCQQNGIHHAKISPRHPRSNGLAEKAVQMLKSACKKNSHPDLEIRLAKILFAYRVTPHCTTGKTPSELLQGRKLKTPLDLMFPQQQLPEEPASEPRSFEPGQRVLVKDNNKWFPGIVERRTGPLSYWIKRDGGKEVIRRHVDHMKARHFEAKESDPNQLPEIDFPVVDSSTSLSLPPELSPSPSITINSPKSPVESFHTPETTPASSLRRYPSRVRKAPVRFSPS